MINDVEKIKKANDIILKLANGINPINEDEVKNNNIMEDPRMMRCFFFVSTKVLFNMDLLKLKGAITEEHIFK